ncbi:hypothetical protein E2C01_019480 [Portunus trituberculatus]|uniref:Uncharacterized protein n=1 Tax=Portunus trituberculatus TaxID=210409 RepID=A0A5B7DZG8_PORTR|nr:hypothetical protein [Portunus trituberculatus]
MEPMVTTCWTVSSRPPQTSSKFTARGFKDILTLCQGKDATQRLHTYPSVPTPVRGATPPTPGMKGEAGTPSLCPPFRPGHLEARPGPDTRGRQCTVMGRFSVLAVLACPADRPATADPGLACLPWPAPSCPHWPLAPLCLPLTPPAGSPTHAHLVPATQYLDQLQISRKIHVNNPLWPVLLASLCH